MGRLEIQDVQSPTSRSDNRLRQIKKDIGLTLSYNVPVMTVYYSNVANSGQNEAFLDVPIRRHDMTAHTHRCRVLLLVCDACLEARDEALSASAQDAPGRSRAGNCQAVDFRSSRHLGATQNSRHTTAEEAGKTAKRHMAEARDAAESAGKAAANLAKPPIATAQGHRSFPTAQREGYDRKSNASTTICDDGVHCGAGGREATATYTELVHACAPDDFESRKRVARVGKELLCPTCDGRSVSTGS